MPGIGIITNPHSKLNRRKPRRSQLLGYILGEHGKMAVTQSLDDLKKVAEKFRDSEVDILAINGGDGTISQTLSTFIDVYGEKPLPRIALLRGGTMNVLAANLGIRGTPERILYRLVETYGSPSDLKIVSLDSLKVENNYGFLFADGMAYTVLEEFYKNKTGPVGAALLILRIAMTGLWNGKLFRRLIKDRHIELSTPKYPTIKRNSLGIAAATIERMPYGFKLFPQARSAPRNMQFFTVYSQAKQILWHLPLILLRRGNGETTGKISLCTNHLDIKGDPGYTYTLDGELHKAQSEQIKIELGPRIEFAVF